MNLREVQALFYGVLSGEVSQDDPRVAAAFVSDARLDASARMHVYADMFLFRQVDALRAEFPMALALLGDEAFFDLARTYIAAYPSEHPDIGQLGRALSTFIAEHAGVRGDLAALAELERARSVSFLALDAPTCAWADLVAHGEAAFVGTRLGFVPALRTISTGFDLAALWKGLSEGEKPEPAPLDAPQIYAVWRRGFEVFHAPLSDAEARGLELARGGATLGEVCEAFAGAEDPARAAFEAIASWFNEGWVAQILPPDA